MTIHVDLTAGINFMDINFLDFARTLIENGQNVFKPIEVPLPLSIREKLFADLNLSNSQKTLLLRDWFLDHARIQVLILHGYDVDPDGVCRLNGVVPDVEYELYKNWT